MLIPDPEIEVFSPSTAGLHALPACQTILYPKLDSELHQKEKFLPHPEATSLPFSLRLF